jgi:hypothetical protein
MTLSIGRAAFLAVVAKKFCLENEQTVLLESIVDSYYKKVESNCMMDLSRIYLDAITFGSLLWIKPELNLNDVIEFISLLYDDETRISKNMFEINRFHTYLTNVYGSTDNIKKIKNPLVLKLLNVII